MSDEHWFDRLNKALVRATPRRTLLGAVAGLVAPSSLVAAPPIAAAKNRKKHKKRQQKKGHKGKPKRCGADDPGSDDQTDCEGYELADDVEFCKDKCARCKAAGLAFCSSHIPDDEHPDIHATCCPRGEMCCDFECCAADRCCDVGAVGGERTCCDPDETCCPGEGCFACEAPLVVNRATCECECRDGTDPPCGCDEGCVGPDLACCDGVCVNLTNDARNCGGCGLRCVDPNRPDCCSRQCVDTNFCRNHCGVCNHRCENYEGCGGGVCRCAHECCNGNDSGVCTGPRFCCPEPCSRCVGETCLRWRDGVVGGYCEERLGECRVVQRYCPFPTSVCGAYDCCYLEPPMETCTATGCERA